MAFADDYLDVAARLRLFKDKHPDGSLQPVNPERPIEVMTVGDKVFLAYAAAAYRTPDDVRPGIGIAWEPFPGTTNFTRNSEAMNAESSAWGRAIVAALAADTKKDKQRAEMTPAQIRTAIASLGAEKGMAPDVIAADFTDWSQGARITVDDVRLLGDYLKHLQG